MLLLLDFFVENKVLAQPNSLSIVVQSLLYFPCVSSSGHYIHRNNLDSFSGSNFKTVMFSWLRGGVKKNVWKNLRKTPN